MAWFTCWCVCLCAGMLLVMTGCARRTEGPVMLGKNTYPAHDRTLEIRQAPHDEKRAIALISRRTLSPPEDLAGFIADAQRYGRRVGADDCAIEVVPDPQGGFVLHGYLQVGKWSALSGGFAPEGLDKMIDQLRKMTEKLK